jgi:beta-glucosidase
MFEYHLKPFIAAIKAGTSSMMPYYAKPIKTEFEEVGFAYSKAIITDLLRKKLGFQGIVNSDTGPIEMMPWGVEGLSILERYQKSLDAGVDLYSGSADPSLLIETVKKGLVSEKRIDESVTRILRERFELGLFENPYVDAEAAQRIVGNANFQKVADIALRKSIVVLKNEKQTLPIKAKTKVYFETYLESGKNNPHYVYQPKSSADYAVEFVKTPEEADQVIVWLMPGTAGAYLAQQEHRLIYVFLKTWLM